MNEKTIHADALINLHKADDGEVERLLAEEIRANPCKIIVLDDDPTGVQTVHDLYVYTDWTVEHICDGLLGENKLFFILTNSRGLLPDETTEIHREIVQNIIEASSQTKVPFFIISRSDSTLRGHYPLETEILRQGLERAGTEINGEILCPYFKEGGRFTLNNVHYVRYGDELVPAAETEFAKDRTFGFHHSNLPEYIEERTNGAYKRENVLCISLEELRSRDYDAIADRLCDVAHFNKVCVNATEDADVKAFCVALYRAMRRGKHFLLRTAAGLVKVIGGVSDRPLLTKEELLYQNEGRGGLVIVGSYTEKSTEQLYSLLELPETEAVAFNSELVLEGEEVLQNEVARCIREEERILNAGHIAVCYTSRKPMGTVLSKEDALRYSVRISRAVQQLVGDLTCKPQFIVAKGGITSSSIGTEALKVRKARVMGQIQPGVPVWQTGEECTFRNIPYIIFPGNVGTKDTLKKAVEVLRG